MDDEQGSVTRWLVQLQQGDQEAADRIWQRYFTRLVELADRKMASMPQRAADGEDIALSAFENFCRAAKGNRFPRLQDRHDLWQLLVMIASRKAVNWHKRERRQKRGAGRVHGNSAFAGACGELSHDALNEIVGDEPTPEFAAIVAEEYARLMRNLETDSLRQIAVWKLEGYTNREIAEKLGRQERTVERKLQLIRKTWSQ